MTIFKYPLSSANGRAIPDEVYGAVSYSAQAITTTPLSPLIEDITFEEHLLYIYCSQDAIISFSEDDSLSADDKVFWMLANTFYLIVPLAKYYDIKAVSTSGIAHINTIIRWDTLTTELQVEQG